MVHVSACDGCDARYFPARLRCPQCGGTHFSARPLDTARVSGVTQVFRASNENGWAWLLEVEATDHLKLIAVAGYAPTAGDVVRLQQQEDGAIVALPA